MQALITRTMVFGVMFTTICNSFYARREDLDGTLAVFDRSEQLDEDYNEDPVMSCNEFVCHVCSNFEDEAELLAVFYKLKQEYSSSKQSMDRVFLASRALGVLKKLSKSENIQKERQLRTAFLFFAKNELLFFGFGVPFIKRFVRNLSWNGQVNAALLQTKLFANKIKRYGFKIGLGIISFIFVIEQLRRFACFMRNNDGRAGQIEFYMSWCSEETRHKFYRFFNLDVN